MRRPDPRLAGAPGPIHPDRVLCIQRALPTGMVSIAAVPDLRPSRPLGDAEYLYVRVIDLIRDGDIPDGRIDALCESGAKL